MHTKTALLIALVAGLATASAVSRASGQTQPVTGHGSHGTHAQMKNSAKTTTAAAPTFAALDANKDGFLSKAELAKHPMAAHASMVDADKDGRLSVAEFKQLQGM
ncbi:EF-hand domain-containing protein [Aerolutibacter ruishenii]|uniref:EF hand domain-containing protein n=1 Tax=Aerolutibacter ruishenii TaxID=686800 RepID=A0A562LV28_9GAMM|nr:EF-hand domain-containing protein [Lysobacter ruishenii]TWI11501.1 EF hand domain-containing protein [Lysobacter ruishenii]